MADLLSRIQELVHQGHVEFSGHAYDQMRARGIDPEDIIAGIRRAILLEDYSTSRGEPRVLVEERESGGRPVHVVWELEHDPEPTAVIVTAIRPE